MQELNILFTCNSAYIIEFYGAFFIENKISICTEFMNGGSIDRYGKIPQNVLGRIAVAVSFMFKLLVEFNLFTPGDIFLYRLNTARKVSKYGVFSGPYFPVFSIESEYRKIRTRKNSVFPYFLRSLKISVHSTVF